MKPSLFLILFIFSGCGASSQQPNRFEDGPIKLSQSVFDMDIPTYFSDEDLFRGNADVQFETEVQDIEVKDSTLYFVEYDQYATPSDHVAATFGEIEFSAISVFSNIDDTEIWGVAAETDLSPEETNQLFATMKATFHVEPIIDQYNRRLAIIWPLEDRVVKLVLNDWDFYEVKDQIENQYYDQRLIYEDDEKEQFYAQLNVDEVWESAGIEEFEEVEVVVFVVDQFVAEHYFPYLGYASGIINSWN